MSYTAASSWRISSGISVLGAGESVYRVFFIELRRRLLTEEERRQRDERIEEAVMTSRMMETVFIA